MSGFPILKNVAFDFPLEYIDSSDDKTHKLTPTITSGDVKVSIDFGAFNNLATLPSVAPAGGSVVKHELSLSEMNGDVIVVEGKDVTGAEWNDWSAIIITSTYQIDVDWIDALLGRDIDNAEGSAAIHSLVTAILKAVSRVRDNAGTLEIYRTDGTTLHMSQTVTEDATLEPVDELGIGT